VLVTESTWSLRRAACNGHWGRKIPLRPRPHAKTTPTAKRHRLVDQSEDRAGRARRVLRIEGHPIGNDTAQDPVRLLLTGPG